ncbi:MAG: prolipoprotein diacylglyceryl transferase [Desulfamplus sp.]|nr:prolipoprotein diacylglyceryl transferase [Desulfamplus sp.]
MISANLLFILSIALMMTAFMVFGFKKFPQEQWQIFAALPLIKNKIGGWKGLNLTYYGIISATAYTFSVGIVIILLGAYHIPILIQMKYIAPILMVAIPASKVVAWIVEGKSSTFTVGGASFTAIIILPWVVMGINAISETQMPLFCFFAAISIGYTYGEALGRLACISFGCCYGKPLSQSGRLMNRLFRKFNFVFEGETKKAAYASNLDGEPTIPIQAITSILYTITAICGTALFLSGDFKIAMLLTIVVTQLWRVVSEFFRADYRGDSGFSAYQVMALVAAFYMVAISIFVSDAIPYNQLLAYSEISDIIYGVKQFWNPTTIICMEIFWVATFLYTGRSFVTGSNIFFHVIKEKI